jgi:hypothetical protein
VNGRFILVLLCDVGLLKKRLQRSQFRGRQCLLDERLHLGLTIRQRHERLGKVYTGVGDVLFMYVIGIMRVYVCMYVCVCVEGKRNERGIHLRTRGRVDVSQATYKFLLLHPFIVCGI